MYLKSNYFFLLFLIFIYSCANIAPPSGGEPDRTPPEIVGHYPQNYTTNFQDNIIEMEFNRYLDKSGFARNLSFSPDVNYKIIWSGKTAKVEFADKLKENTTYTMNIGTDYRDYYKAVEPTESFSLVFSTGSVIDSGQINGIVYGEDIKNAFVYAYNIENMNSDTFDLRNSKSDYRAQLGSSGEFSIKGLKDGKYRVIAVTDEFQDAVYNEGVDRFGAANNDVEIIDSQSPYLQVVLGPSIDRIPPEMIFAESYNSNLINLKMSEKIEISSVDNSSFELFDENNRKYQIISAFVNPIERMNIKIISKVKLDTTFKFTLRAKDNGALTLQDSSSNKISEDANSIEFKSIEGAEVIPKLDSLFLKDSTINFLQGNDIYFALNYPLQDLQNSITYRLYSLNDSVKYKMELIRVNDVFWKFNFLEELPFDNWMRLELEIEKAIGMNQIAMADTSIKIDFKTFDRSDLSSISGTISSQYCENLILIAKGKANTYKAIPTNLKWEFNGITPGVYQFEAFCDKNGNNMYDFGQSFPYEYSETIIPMSGEVSARPRWSMEDIKLQRSK